MSQIPPDIAALVARAQHGDRECIATIFELLHGRIYRFFAFRTSERETAEDLTQTTFLEMIRALPRYKVQTDAKFTTWLFQIARFRLIDHYRKSGRTIPLDEAPEPIDKDEERMDSFDVEAMDTALKQLPERYQTVLHLRYREDLTTGEIAAAMRTSALNVRVLQHRALNALRRIIHQERS